MKIVSVHLKNYRSHEDLSVAFDDGINLLIGQNGAGKSSILEAIGLALFDASLRSTNKHAVKFGQKSAVITVQFIGIDGNEYRVERKIGQSAHWRLFCGGEKSHRYQGNEQVLVELRKLTGVKQNEKKLFSDVICAVQNKFTDLFSQTETNRETTFNLLFETDIYRNIFQRFTGDNSIERNYSDEKTAIEGKLTILDEIVIDSEFEKNEIERISAEKIVAEKELVEVNTLFELVEKSVKASAEKIAEYHSKEKESTSLQSELVTLNGALKESTRLIEQSELSQKIVTENQSHYDQFEKLRLEQNKLESSIEKESLYRHRESELSAEIESLLKQKNEIETRIAVIKTEQVSSEEKVKQSNEELSSLQNSRVKTVEKQNAVVESGKKLKVITDGYQTLLDDLKLAQKERDEIQWKLNNRPEKNDPAIMNNELEQCRSEIEKLVGLQNSLQKFQSDRTVQESKLNELFQAQRELATGICPILKENCQNTNATHENGDYFSTRSAELQQMIAQIDREIEPLLAVPNQLEEQKGREKTVEIQLKAYDDNQKELSIIIEKEKLITEKTSLIVERLRLVEPEIVVDDSAFEDRWNSVLTEKNGLTEEYKFLQRELSSLDERIAIHQQTIQCELQSLETFTSELTQLQSSQLQLNETGENKRRELASITVELTRCETVRAEITVLRNSMSEFETGYRLVLENRESAEKRSEYTTNRDFTTAKLSEKTSLLNSLSEYLNTENLENLETEQTSLIEKQKECRNRRDVCKEKIVQIDSEILHHTEQLKKALEQGERVERLKNDQSKLERKLELTGMFRQNIKEMGRFVASNLVETIAFDATNYYQQITGRSETVQWLVNDTDKYTVFLVSGSGDTELRREFAVLSGGEQVAVALSLRTAMVQELAGGEFAIFDEPTINLDTERKIALAESIKSMLGTLKQTIIVTHDDVFREMAQNIVELT